LVYLAVGSAAVTAQDTQPGRATFAEMIAFARLASVPCQRLAPDADSFHAWRSGGSLNRPSPRKRLLPKKKISSGFEFVSGLADGASAMPAKWRRRIFSFRFYEGKISVPVTLTSYAFRKSYPDITAQKGAWSGARPNSAAGSAASPPDRPACPAPPQTAHDREWARARRGEPRPGRPPHRVIC
jgi:hypothetical protein